MTVSDFTICECKVREAAATGTLVDLRVGDSAIDSPEKGTEWGSERTVRAEVIVDLLIGNGEAASMAVRGVRLQGARITGDLNLEATTLRCPLALLHCSFASAINLNEATAVSVRLSGSRVPAIHARQLLTRGDLRLDEGFNGSGEIDLVGAHISGQFVCTGGQFSNPDGCALNAFGLSVEGGIAVRGLRPAARYSCGVPTSVATLTARVATSPTPTAMPSMPTGSASTAACTAVRGSRLPGRCA